ncbi:MAG TPA: IPT/TIG domain-containing protein [Holophaga sp.]|nr:IPT/TIG domain-containing protein [Holophaga sp.]
MKLLSRLLFPLMSCALFLALGCRDSKPDGPAIQAIQPASGPRGTTVEITGRGLGGARRVLFNGTEAQAFQEVDEGRILANVPTGATTGPIRVETREGDTLASPGTFTVTPGPSALTLAEAGWYLTQATQDLDRSVPLVANRDGFLRVFLRASALNLASPSIRATIIRPDGQIWTALAQPPGLSVPVRLDEGTLEASWNLPVPGTALAPGSLLTLALVPGGAMPEAAPVWNEGPRPLDVRVMQPLRVTLVPIVQANGAQGDVTLGGTRTLADWADLLKRLFPVATTAGGVDIQVGTPLASTQTLVPDNDGPWAATINELELKRMADNALDRFYFGVVRLGWDSGTLGLTGLGALTHTPFALGTDAPDAYQRTFAHEMGHVLGRDHAPCGGVVAAPGNWPDAGARNGAYTGGRIGIFGLDVARRELKDPARCTDIMGYCADTWISDFTYRGILNRGFAIQPAPAGQNRPAAAYRSAGSLNPRLP